MANCIQQWLAALRDALDRELVVIDGKTPRASFDTAAGQNPLHLVSAGEARLVLGRVAVATHSKEITAIPLLLEVLDLQGVIVTTDTLGCQKEIAEANRGQEAAIALGLQASLRHGGTVAHTRHFVRKERSTQELGIDRVCATWHAPRLSWHTPHPSGPLPTHPGKLLRARGS